MSANGKSDNLGSIKLGIKWTPDNKKCEEIEDLFKGFEKKIGKLFLSIVSGNKFIL